MMGYKHVVHQWAVNRIEVIYMAACKKLYDMQAMIDMLLPYKGSGTKSDKGKDNGEGDSHPGTTRDMEFYLDGVSHIFQDSYT
ncbi:unnamed protein product [Cuscuta campestris]|uniref:Uncharacterized protein n=1 Tax=Cuscuta campestris TaxID=132261 RepID=A0A484KQS1_9ASTE|nr:unnamed protein product [Cuscuta campestris]